MSRKNKNFLIFFIAIFIPALTLIAPNWLQINGISPCWPIIWLLPFSLQNGPWRAAFCGLLMGIFMDSFIIGDVSYIPSLFFLSLVWGRFGIRHKNIEIFLNIGFMAILGSACVSFSIWVQNIAINSVLRNHWFHSWAIYTLISEILITGLVAPLFSSWLLLPYKKANGNNLNLKK